MIRDHELIREGELPSNFRLLRYSIYVGGGAAVIGLLVATLTQTESAGTVWLATTATLAVCGGIIAVPILRQLDQKRSHRERRSR